jgi:hypothetical protein
MRSIRHIGTFQLGVVAALAVLFVATSMSPAGAQEQLGILTAFKGDVSVVRTAQPGQPVKANVQDKLFQGDVVRTGVGGTAKVLLKDDTLLTVGEETELEIAQALFEPAAGRRSTTVKLLHGVARAVVLPLENPHPDSRFSFDTPTAVIGVRGSEGACRVIRKDNRWKTKCCSRRDVWEVENKDPSVEKRRLKLQERHCTECLLGESCKAPWPMSATEDGLLFPSLREMASTLPRAGQDIPVTGLPELPRPGQPLGPPNLKDVIGLQSPAGQGGCTENCTPVCVTNCEPKPSFTFGSQGDPGEGSN